MRTAKVSTHINVWENWPEKLYSGANVNEEGKNFETLSTKKVIGY